MFTMARARRESSTSRRASTSRSMASTSSSVAMVKETRSDERAKCGNSATAALQRQRGRGDPGARACVLCAVVVSLVAYRLTLRLLPTVEAKALKRNSMGPRLGSGSAAP